VLTPASLGAYERTGQHMLLLAARAAGHLPGRAEWWFRGAPEKALRALCKVGLGNELEPNATLSDGYDHPAAEAGVSIRGGRAYSCSSGRSLADATGVASSGPGWPERVGIQFLASLPGSAGSLSGIIDT
jgi:hypothetical protein